MMINNVRQYSDNSANVVLLHGGPGAPGELQQMAGHLAAKFTVLEAFQTHTTIAELIVELHQQVTAYCRVPISLVGYSWGAWLAILFAARFPRLVNKLILISCGPLTTNYADTIQSTRLTRLSPQQQQLFIHLQQQLIQQPDVDLMIKLLDLINKTDHYAPFTHPTEINFNFQQHYSIWSEASQLRISGELLRYCQAISCPLTIIHGDYDPHPFAGVLTPLSHLMIPFRSHILPLCGHTPWIERYAQTLFYTVLHKTLTLM